MNKKQVIVVSVLAALGVGVPLTNAINSAAQENQVSQREVFDELRAASLDAAVVLKMMGLNKTQAEDELVASSSADRQSMKNIVQASFNRAQERDGATIRTINMSVLVPVGDVGFWSKYASVLCEPIKGRSVRAIHAKCVNDNDDVQGVPICRNGVHHSNLIRMPVTDRQFERLSRLQGVTILTDDPEPHLAGAGLANCVFE